MLGVLPACMSVLCECLVQRPEEGVGAPGMGVVDGCEQTCRWWELNQALCKSAGVLLSHLSSLVWHYLKIILKRF